jgi:hypothetical protein
LSSSQQITSIVQSAEVRGGFEFVLAKPRSLVLFPGPTYKATLSLSLIAGGALATPFASYDQAALGQEFCLSPLTSSGGTTSCPPAFSAISGTVSTNVQQQFINNPQLQTEYPQLFAATCGKLNASGQCSVSIDSKFLYRSVAFVLPDRSRLYRTYFGGFRFNMHQFQGSNCVRGDDLHDPNKCKFVSAYPGTLDVTFGQDERVTGGQLQGVVMSVGGNFPFPRYGYLRLFGSANFRLRYNQNHAVLQLPPLTNSVALSDPSVFVQPIQPADQDFYRIGVGVDIVELIKQLKGTKGSSAPKNQVASGNGSTASSGSATGGNE